MISSASEISSLFVGNASNHHAQDVRTTWIDDSLSKKWLHRRFHGSLLWWLNSLFLTCLSLWVLLLQTKFIMVTAIKRFCQILILSACNSLSIYNEKQNKPTTCPFMKQTRLGVLWENETDPKKLTTLLIFWILF